MRSEKVFEKTARFLEAEGEFAERHPKYDGDPVGDFEMMFLPFLRSLNITERRRAVEIIGDVALGRLPELEGRCQDAREILFRLALPWPEDHRELLLALKEPLLREFNDRQNLTGWMEFQRGQAIAEWRRDIAHALWLYWLLLAVASDDELAPVVDTLMGGARDRRCRVILGRYKEIRDGTRMASPTQIAEQEFRRRTADIYRRDAKHPK